LLLMSIIPSKRVDRIFPVVPPFCLLVGAQVACVWQNRQWASKLLPWLRVTLLFAFLYTGGYAVWKITSAYRSRSDALVRFSSAVRAQAAQHRWNYGVVGRQEEGMLLYLRRDHFLSPNDAEEQWRAGKLDAVVVRDQPARDWPTLLPGAELQATSEKAKDLPRYALFVRR
jgi:hypothetical protein